MNNFFFLRDSSIRRVFGDIVSDSHITSAFEGLGIDIAKIKTNGKRDLWTRIQNGSLPMKYGQPGYLNLSTEQRIIP